VVVDEGGRKERRVEVVSQFDSLAVVGPGR
jgi:hypothetical protein